MYRTFNANQNPLVIADFKLPTESCDINVSPDKRTIFVHSEDNLVTAFKVHSLRLFASILLCTVPCSQESLEATFFASRSTYAVGKTQKQKASQQPLVTRKPVADVESDEDQLLEDDDPTSKSGETQPAAQDQSSDLNMQEEAHVSDMEIPRVSRSDETESCDQDCSEPTSAVESPSESSSRGSLQLGSGQPSKTPGHESEATSSPTSSRRVSPVQLDNVGPFTPSKPLFIPSPVASRAWSHPKVPMDDAEESGFTQVLSPVGTRKSFTVTPEKPALKPVPQQKAKSAGRQVQATLSTTGASWSLRRRRDDDSDEPRKKAKVHQNALSKATKVDFKTRLTGYAMAGSQASNGAAESVDEDADIGVDEDSQASEKAESEDDGADRDGTMEEAEDYDQEVKATEGSDSTNRSQSVDEDLRPELPDREQSQIRTSTPKDRPTSTASKGSFKRPIEVAREVAARKDVIDLTLDDDPLPGLYTQNTSSSSQAVAPAADVPTIQTTVRVDFDRLSHLWAGRSSSSSQSRALRRSLAKVQAAAGPSNAGTDGSAEKELSRVIAKHDFNAMAVIGQFNKGFIIARLKKSPAHAETDGEDLHQSGAEPADDLFLIDQHAADEKYNFENLQITTKIQSQMLVR